MVTAEEIKKVLVENPSILVDVLIARPEIIYQVLSRLTPWQNLATKTDLENLRKDIDIKFDTLRKELEGKMATKEDLQKMATKEDLQKMATKEDLQKMATKEDLQKMATKEDLQKMATKEDLQKLEKRLITMINGIGARWGVKNEDSFRQGVVELLSDVGFTANRELLYDNTGYVYGDPSDVEIDVVLKNGKVIMIEISSGIRRGDVGVILKKKEFYEKAKGVKVDEVIVITSIIEDRDPDRVKARAESLGIKIITPSDIQ
ncbi:PD-(D/E)XK nuclease family protein [Sulfolobus acidocaldarius]|uniref:PD-(D/E)XK nuclease family protein n=1 Tax=Sulfolobus acidocaldarius TaxID=2285 RepID=UPI000B5A610A|nr:PD-(D/E)XK nuclease family protein [Sulfolobus acidocaldarius]